MKTAISAALLVAASPAAAADFMDHAALDRAAQAFAGAAIGKGGGPAQPIDRRLHLARCPSDPAMSWRSERHDAIVIECPAVGWRIFVPVQAAPARAVAAAPPEPVIRRGDVVTLVAEQPGFSVSSQGTAMRNAAPGERLPVRIEGVRAPVQAVAIEAGRAALPGWSD